MQVRDCMKRSVVSISVSANISQAAARLSNRHIGMLPVVDNSGKLVGILELWNLIELIMPDFIRLLEDFDFVHDFGAVETQHPSAEIKAKLVSDVMDPPVSVEESCGLLRAFAMLQHHDISDLPVVSTEGRLVGIASRVDIGAALLSSWRAPESESR